MDKHFKGAGARMLRIVLNINRERGNVILGGGN